MQSHIGGTKSINYNERKRVMRVKDENTIETRPFGYTEPEVHIAHHNTAAMTWSEYKAREKLYCTA
jgi:hypothetical protein